MITIAITLTINTIISTTTAPAAAVAATTIPTPFSPLSPLPPPSPPRNYLGLTTLSCLKSHFYICLATFVAVNPILHLQVSLSAVER